MDWSPQVESCFGSAEEAGSSIAVPNGDASQREVLSFAGEYIQDAVRTLTGLGLPMATTVSADGYLGLNHRNFLPSS
ncbi:hypothetical protein BJX68DRAFT_265743 [Aspergillus pseudodeflectus]|uniref:Uncharacterized protein n=1 Tax=Aspergillus pseudodeflectus TaxID=176178 RepID=A0ABR4KLU0_9EURO